MKKIVGGILVLMMLTVVFVGCGACNDDTYNNGGADYDVNTGYYDDVIEADTFLDGTWAHGTETIVFDGENFEISGGAGHRHLPNGAGTFVETANEMIFTYDDGNVVTIAFARDGDAIRIQGHRYPRQ